MRGNLSCCSKDIADSPNRANQTSTAFQLLAQMADVDIENAVIGRGIALQQSQGDFVSRDDASCGAHQHLQQTELHCGQFGGRVCDPDFASDGIDSDIPDGDVGVCFPAGCFSAAQDGVNSGEEFIGIEGVEKIVVRACVEPENPVAMLDT